MTDRRSQDPTEFYDLDGPATLPVARDVEDLPSTPAGEAFRAGWRTAKDDWPGETQNQIISAYGPLIAALKAETGRTEADYLWIGHSTAGVNERLVFADIAKVRARNRQFLPDVPDTVDGFRASVVDRLKQRREGDLLKLERARGGGALAGYAGTFAGAAADPVNLATLPVGGGGATIARRVLGEALVNMSVEALEQPMIAGERAQRGEKLTLGEAALNVGVAGLAGAAVQGVVVEPLSALARRRLASRATELERAAINVVEREEEIDATSPFKPGPGSEVHAARMVEAERVLNGEQPPRPQPTKSPELARETVKGRIRRAESSPTDDYNEATGAMGPYQFLASTWTRLYKRKFGAGGLSDAQIAAKRRDPALNEQLMDMLMADNERALAAIGARATPGNLYLAHFAGAAGARAVLKAAGDVPVERLLRPIAIEKNPFLRGMTADDLIRWAHRKMGGDPDGPTLRRDQFESDGEWEAAQRAVDLAEDEVAAARRAVSEAGDSAEVSARAATRAADDELVGMDLWPDAGPGAEIRMYRAAGAAADDVEAPVRLVSDRAQAAASEDGRVEVVRLDKATIDELAPLREDGSREIDRALADALAELEPPSNLTAPPAARGMAEDFIISPHMIAERGVSGYRVEKADDGSFATVVLRGYDGRAKAGLFVPTHPEALENFGGLISYVSPDIRRKGVATRLYNIAREAGLPVDELSGRGDLTPDGAAFVAAWREREAPLRSPGADRFDDGIDGAGARATTQSLEHDLRMALADNPDEMVRLDDGGDIRLADMLDDLEADDAAVAAARACMVPRGRG